MIEEIDENEEHCRELALCLFVMLRHNGGSFSLPFDEFVKLVPAGWSEWRVTLENKGGYVRYQLESPS
ncbi:MAG TPA: hypothetical protein VFV58_39405 [Blastocatellia bacterium]|jgi:hypothetical protein|nr:hypothetical protein [Blastocatellia bacterium]